MSRFWPLSLPVISLWAIATSGLGIADSNRAIASPYDESSHASLSAPHASWVDPLAPLPIPSTGVKRSPSPSTTPTMTFPSVWQLATDVPPDPPVPDDSAPAFNPVSDPTADSTLEPVDTLITGPEVTGPDRLTLAPVSELASESTSEVAPESETDDPAPNVSAPDPVTDSVTDPVTDDNGSVGDGSVGDRSITDTPSNVEAEIPPDIDPDLGILRLRPLAPPPPRRRPVSIAGQMSFFSGNNLLARSEPEADDIFEVGLSLRAVPRLSSRTFLIGSAEVSTLRYVKNDDFDYNQLELRFGVYHYLTRRMYTDLHWRNQQFFQLDGGDRFLNSHQLRWAVGRIDPINPNLTLNSAYQLQMSWAEPVERSRISNRFYLGLTQELTPDFEAGLSYQFMLDDYTRQDRNNSYHQVLAQLRYAFSDTTSLAVFGGGRWGDSTNDLIDFDTALLGVSFSVNVPLF